MMRRHLVVVAMVVLSLVAVSPASAGGEDDPDFTDFACALGERTGDGATLEQYGIIVTYQNPTRFNNNTLRGYFTIWVDRDDDGHIDRTLYVVYDQNPSGSDPAFNCNDGGYRDDILLITRWRWLARLLILFSR